MNSFKVFLKKEWLELIRTKKFFILLCIFALFGMMGPVAAKYMQQIIAMAMGSSAPISVQPATWMDSWSQFYSNAFQMGSLCSIFIFMGCITNEKVSGAAALTLTKNLSHAKFVLAKYVAAITSFLISFVCAIIICYVYTYLLFGFAGELNNIIFGGFMYIMVIITLISITVLASALSNSITVSALLSFMGFVFITISSYIPVIGDIMPGALLSKVVKHTTGVSSESVLLSFLAVAIICFGCIFIAIESMKKKEI